MADAKLTALDQLSTPASGDYLYIVDDPAGTPVSKYITYSDFTSNITTLGTLSTGLDINPGSDIDTDLITLNVTGTPTLSWDESQDTINFNHGLDINGISQFGDLSPQTGVQLKIGKTYTDTSGTLYGLLSTLNVSPGSNGTATVYGQYSQVLQQTDFNQNLLVGFRGDAQNNSTAGTVTSLYGVYGTAINVNGKSATSTFLVGGRFTVDVEDGISTDASGIWVHTPYVDTGSITRAYGLQVSQGTKGAGSIGTLYGISIAALNNASTSVNYGLLINSITGAPQNYAIRAYNGRYVFNENGDASSYFRVEGDTDANLLYINPATDRIGVGLAGPAGKLHVQTSATGAEPVLYLDQADLSEEFIEFATTVGAGNPIDTAAEGAYYGKLRVMVNGVGYKVIKLYEES